jgi:hypothetical protein
VVLALAWSVSYSAFGDREASALWFFDHIMLGLFLFAVWRGRPWLTQLSGRWAAIAFVVLSWLSGMLYELTLTHEGSMFGGFASTASASFSLAQGWYPTFALLGLFLLRRYRYTFSELFFAAGAASIFEVVMIALPAIVAVPFMAPLTLAYFVTVYGLFLTWPLLFINERRLWSEPGHAISFMRKILYGVAAGWISWLTFGLLSMLLGWIAPGFAP